MCWRGKTFIRVCESIQKARPRKVAVSYPVAGTSSEWDWRMSTAPGTCLPQSLLSWKGPSWADEFLEAWKSSKSYWILFYIRYCCLRTSQGVPEPGCAPSRQTEDISKSSVLHSVPYSSSTPRPKSVTGNSLQHGSAVPEDFRISAHCRQPFTDNGELKEDPKGKIAISCECIEFHLI